MHEMNFSTNELLHCRSYHPALFTTLGGCTEFIIDFKFEYIYICVCVCVCVSCFLVLQGSACTFLEFSAGEQEETIWEEAHHYQIIRCSFMMKSCSTLQMCFYFLVPLTKALLFALLITNYLLTLVLVKWFRCRRLPMFLPPVFVYGIEHDVQKLSCKAWTFVKRCRNQIAYYLYEI